MRLTYLPEDQFTLSELAEPRQPGVHYSDLIKLLQREREPSKFFDSEAEEWTDKDLLRLEVGHTFEGLLSGALTRRHPGWVRPSPLTLDGVICSPDGWMPQEQRLEEWKASWMSLSREAILLDFRWWWFYQMPCYAHVIEQVTGVTVKEAVLRVFYVNGDYSRKDFVRCAACGEPSGGPHVHAYRVTWYPEEPAEKWRELVNLGIEYQLLQRTPVGIVPVVKEDKHVG